MTPFAATETLTGPVVRTAPAAAGKFGRGGPT